MVSAVVHLGVRREFRAWEQMTICGILALITGADFEAVDVFRA